MTKILHIKINHEDDTPLDALLNLLKYESFNYSYWKGFVPPNHIEISFDALTELGCVRWVESLKEISNLKFQYRIEENINKE